MAPDDNTAAAAPASPGGAEAIVAAEAAAPAVQAAPAVEQPASTSEAAGAAPAVEAHTDTPSFLETLTAAEPVAPTEPAAPTEPKPAEPAPTEAAAPAEAQKPAEPAAPAVVTYEPFKLPEGVTADESALKAYGEVVGKHGVPQEQAQALLDMHTKALTDYATNIAAEQHRAFADIRSQWRQKIAEDPELGGSGHQTTMRAVARMRDRYVPEQHRAEFDDFLRTTGAGDHPALIRLLHRVARDFDEPGVPSQVGAPPKANGRQPGGIGSLYTHPSSERLRQA